tara:strand:- start:133 stop:312 length:180 start_codon:yes stop_codon:yes gene_type:complete
MEIRITCHFCFESFAVTISEEDGRNIEIWDCEICCNPNSIFYNIANGKLIQIEISNGND